MLSERRGFALWFTCALAAALVLPAAAEELRLEGTLGFGMTLRKQAGRFAWDWESAREETTLAELKLGYTAAPGFAALVRFGAGLESAHADEAPRFERGAAALVYAHPVGSDSLGLRLFARQPSALWLDHGLAVPVDPGVLGDDAQGLRAAYSGRHGMLLFLGADASTAFPATSDAARDVRFILLRFRADSSSRQGLRFGGTYTLQRTAGGAPRRDRIGFDLRFLVAGVQAQVDYAVLVESDSYHAPTYESTTDAATAAATPGPLTGALTPQEALRAELRTVRLGNPRWGWFGFAPSYRASGAEHTNPLVRPEASVGSPIRGLEGYRLEAWYTAASWPLWLRQSFDRHQQFRDAARRVIQQESEIEAVLARDVAARLRYSQTQVRGAGVAADVHHDAFTAELRATSGATRVRAQAGWLDGGTPAEREVFALEGTVRVSSRVQALGRASWAREASRLREALFAEVQYWSLPQFEVSLQYGPDWIGDRADPSLDADLVAASAQRDVVRLHFRGWF